MRLLSRAGGRTDRQRSLFEASAVRLSQAIEAAIAADLMPFWVDEDQMQALWRKAAQCPMSPILPSGRVLAVLTIGTPYQLKYLNLNRASMRRATIEHPAPMLLLARAIDRVMEDASGPEPDRLEYVAYFHTNGQIRRTQGSTVPEEYTNAHTTLQRLRRLASS